MSRFIKLYLLCLIAIITFACSQNKDQASTADTLPCENEPEMVNNDNNQDDDFTKTSFTWEDSKGDLYPVYMKKNGSCFVIRTSKSGKNYRSYLGEEVSEQIANEIKTKHNQ